MCKWVFVRIQTCGAPRTLGAANTELGSRYPCFNFGLSSRHTTTLRNRFPTVVFVFAVRIKEVLQSFVVLTVPVRCVEIYNGFHLIFAVLCRAGTIRLAKQIRCGMLNRKFMRVSQASDMSKII